MTAEPTAPAAPSVDPWTQIDWAALPLLSGQRRRYTRLDDERGEWTTDSVVMKVEPASFAKGNMRACFRAKLVEAATITDAENASADFWASQRGHVAKLYHGVREIDVYESDVVMQMYAKALAAKYNALTPSPPRKVDFLAAFLVQTEQIAAFARWASEGAPLLFHVEEFVAGEYRKHSNNAGAVGCFAVDGAADDVAIRNTPQAFSHFTYEATGGRCMVVDIQGIGDMYTDPQIHSTDGHAYGKGNLGLQGMAMFFSTHLCQSRLCQQLQLKIFQLSHEEVRLLRSEQNRSAGATVLAAAATPRRQGLWLAARTHAEAFDQLTASASGGGLALIESMPTEFPDVPPTQEARLHFLVAGLKRDFRLSAYHLLLAADMGDGEARAAVRQLQAHYRIMRARRGDALTTTEFLETLGGGNPKARAGFWSLERIALASVSVALLGTLVWLWRDRRSAR